MRGASQPIFYFCPKVEVFLSFHPITLLLYKEIAKSLAVTENSILQATHFRSDYATCPKGVKSYDCVTFSYQNNIKATQIHVHI